MKEVCRERGVGVAGWDGGERSRARRRTERSEWKDPARSKSPNREGKVRASLRRARPDKRSCHVGSEVQSLWGFFAGQHVQIADVVGMVAPVWGRGVELRGGRRKNERGRRGVQDVELVVAEGWCVKMPSAATKDQGAAIPHGACHGRRTGRGGRVFG